MLWKTCLSILITKQTKGVTQTVRFSVFPPTVVFCQQLANHSPSLSCCYSSFKKKKKKRDKLALNRYLGPETNHRYL